MAFFFFKSKWTHKAPVLSDVGNAQMTTDSLLRSFSWWVGVTCRPTSARCAATVRRPWRGWWLTVWRRRGKSAPFSHRWDIHSAWHRWREPTQQPGDRRLCEQTATQHQLFLPCFMKSQRSIPDQAGMGKVWPGGHMRPATLKSLRLIPPIDLFSL